MLKTYTLTDIKNVAIDLLALIGNTRVVALHGEMGSGKTTLVHAVCEELGVTDVVGSPTFSIINEYKSAHRGTIYHIDLYRIKDEAEAMEAGVEDCLYSGALCFIEWPEKAPGLLPLESMHIKMSVVGDDKRSLQI